MILAPGIWCRSTSWKSGPATRIIEILVHFHHFERVHDPPEQRVVELNRFAVVQFLHVLERDSDRDFCVLHWMCCFQIGWIVLEKVRKVEAHAVEGLGGTEYFAELSQDLESLVPAVHGGLEPHLVLVHSLLLGYL